MSKSAGGEFLIGTGINLSRRTLAACAILALASFLAYSPSLRGGFVYDDPFFITYNDYIKSLGNLWSFFSDYRSVSPLGYDINRDIYRPLRTASYAIEYRLWGLNPAGYHLVNILFHSANAVLTFIALRLLLRRHALSLALALFFAFHPANVDAVAWISSRGDLMAYFFALLSFIFYAFGSSWATVAAEGAPRRRLRSRAFCAASLVAFAASLLSKESAIVVPALLITADICFDRRKHLGWKSARYLPYIGVAGLYLVARYAVVGQLAQRAYWGESPYFAALTMAKALAYYIKLLSFPTALRLIYNMPIAKSLLDLRVIASLGILSAAIFCALYLWRSSKGGFFGLAWFALAMLPVSNIVPIKALIVEHYLYLPMFGFIVALGFSSLLIDRLEPLRTSRSARLAATFACLILIFNLALALKRNLVWIDEERLWKDAAAKSPGSYKAHYNLGNVLNHADRIDKAAVEYLQALRIDPGLAEPHNNLGVILRKRGLTVKGAGQFEAAVALKPDYADAHFNLGNAMKSLESGDKSMAEYAFAIFSDNSFYRAYNNMGVALFEKGLLDKAAPKYKRAIALSPTFADAHYNLGLLSLKRGERERALEAFAKFKINCGCDEKTMAEVDELTRRLKGGVK